jgi:lysophospholipid acyltransferase (LPLAT)-like uncharacterized protein
MSAAQIGPERPRPPRPDTQLSVKRRYQWIGRLGAAVLHLWGRTLRIERDIPPAVRALEDGGEHLVYAFWHCHILPLTWAYRGRSLVVLVSEHGDGETITQIIHHLGYGTVRGSTTRGGARAALTMARLGKAGHPLGVTPDGPRGPRHVLQPGVLLIAGRSRLPVVPVAIAMQRGRCLDSWDRFEIPAPFSRIWIVAGEPIHVPEEMGEEEAALWQRRVQEGMDDVERRAVAWRERRR